MTRRGAVVVLILLLALVVGWAGSGGGATSPQWKLRVLRFVDRSRLAHYRNGESGPRLLVTQIRYPVHGQGPFPLVVFAHGFELTPTMYARLLDTWSAAGYVVAAPEFPVEGADAPGGPDRSDLGNEPGDISFVISRLTAPTSPVRGLVDATRIAVAGHSDGAVAALSAAYDRRFRDRRIDAALVFSGATLPGFVRAPTSPPLLAVQGTADTLNPPATTTYYFGLMRRPKFLLWLEGAPHREPFTARDRWSGVVMQATTAFLAHTLRGAPLGALVAAGTRPGVAHIESDP